MSIIVPRVAPPNHISEDEHRSTLAHRLHDHGHLWLQAFVTALIAEFDTIQFALKYGTPLSVCVKGLAENLERDELIIFEPHKPSDHSEIDRIDADLAKTFGFRYPGYRPHQPKYPATANQKEQP